MEWIEKKESIAAYVRKYKYLFLMILLGILLMVVPETGKKEQGEQTPYEEKPCGLQEALEEILSHVSGAGNVKVLLTEAEGEYTVYQENENSTENSIRRESVIVSSSNGDDWGLIRQTNPPVYQGAVIVCEGADDANVRLSVVKAVMSATGLTSDHITVLKME